MPLQFNPNSVQVVDYITAALAAEEEVKACAISHRVVNFLYRNKTKSFTIQELKVAIGTETGTIRAALDILIGLDIVMVRYLTFWLSVEFLTHIERSLEYMQNRNETKPPFFETIYKVKGNEVTTIELDKFEASYDVNKGDPQVIAYGLGNFTLTPAEAAQLSHLLPQAD